MLNNGNINEEKLIEDMKAFINQNGYDGFFGLIAKLAPDKVDKEDLANYGNIAPSVTDDMKPISTAHLDQFKIVPSNETPVKEASIYAEKHIQAVQLDKEEEKTLQSASEQAQVVDTPKARVLEPERKKPNPWGDAEVVSPGQLKL